MKLMETPELRKDPVTNRWVIFSPSRAKRPSDFKSKSPQNPNNHSPSCPFCIGNEHQCAPKIFRVPPHPNWKLRIIENLYPTLSRILDHSDGRNSDPSSELGGWGWIVQGFGFHDVVIETPVHSVQLSDLDLSQIGDVFIAYKKRIEQIKKFDSIKYIQVFKNHGASAGASMSHSHNQIISLHIAPPSVSTRLDSMKENFNQTGKRTLYEVQSKDLLINETRHFVSIASYVASFPFEIWIIPHYDELDKERDRFLTREPSFLGHILPRIITLLILISFLLISI